MQLTHRTFKPRIGPCCCSLNRTGIRVALQCQSSGAVFERRARGNGRFPIAPWTTGQHGAVTHPRSVAGLALNYRIVPMAAHSLITTQLRVLPRVRVMPGKPSCVADA
jgi:hypothetical protein